MAFSANYVILGFQLCVIVSLTKMPTSVDGERLWSNPCVDPRHMVSSNRDGNGMAASRWSSSAQLMPLAEKLARRLQDTTDAVDSATLHVKGHYGGNEEHVQRLDSMSPIRGLFPRRHLPSDESERLPKLLSKVYETLSRAAIFVKHMRAQQQPADNPELPSILRAIEHGSDTVNMGGIYPLMCEIFLEMPPRAVPEVRQDIVPSSFTAQRNLAIQRDNRYRALKSARQALQGVRNELVRFLEE